MTADQSSLLLGELNHRVGNSFQLMISILSLQAAHYVDSGNARAVRRAADRVRAVAFIHDARYTSRTHDVVHFGPCLQQLVSELAHSHNVPDLIKVRVASEDVAIDMGVALPLVVIAGELVANAFEHAFPKGAAGIVAVTFRYCDPTCERAELLVSDNGRGLMQEVNFETAGSFGIYLVNILAKQLNATVEVYREAGAEVRVRIPLTD